LDHCPLVLKYRNDNWAPKPFRFNNFWLENKDFVKVVESYWVNHNVEGRMWFVLKEKLKGLKLHLKEWHKVEYGGLEARIEGLVGDIKDLDAKVKTAGLSNQEINTRKEKFIDLWRFLESKDANLFQRSRSKWLKEGDGNTKVFHGCIKARSKLNTITVLRVENDWLDSPNLIKAAVSSYFVNHVTSKNWSKT
jgi:hypothetical protein